jgi:hypothetical protein
MTKTHTTEHLIENLTFRKIAVTRKTTANNKKNNLDFSKIFTAFVLRINSGKFDSEIHFKIKRKIYST